MADDLPSFQRLRGGIVGRVRVGERTSDEVGNLDIDIEILIGRNSITGSWVGDDGRNHVATRRDVPHYWTQMLINSRLITSSRLPMPLQEPPVICLPSVNCLPEQKLMKLALSLVPLVN